MHPHELLWSPLHTGLKVPPTLLHTDSCHFPPQVSRTACGAETGSAVCGGVLVLHDAKWPWPHGSLCWEHRVPVQCPCAGNWLCKCFGKRDIGIYSCINSLSKQQFHLSNSPQTGNWVLELWTCATTETSMKFWVSGIPFAQNQYLMPKRRKGLMWELKSSSVTAVKSHRHIHACYGITIVRDNHVTSGI